MLILTRLADMRRARPSWTYQSRTDPGNLQLSVWLACLHGATLQSDEDEGDGEWDVKATLGPNGEPGLGRGDLSTGLPTRSRFARDEAS